jgi:hypothetical protein
MHPLWRGSGFETWAILLARLGYYWEATEILYEMVQLLSLDEAEDWSRKLLSTLHAANLGEADQLAGISALWIYSSVEAAAAEVQINSVSRGRARSYMAKLFKAIQSAEILKEHRQSCKKYFKWAELALYIGSDDPKPPRLSELLRTAADAGDFGSFWDLADDGYGSTINGGRSWLQENGRPHETLSVYDHVAEDVLGDQLQHLQDLNSKLSSCTRAEPSPEVVAFVRDTLAECDVFDTAFPLWSTAVSTTHQFRVPRIRYQVEKQKEYWWTFLQNHEASRKAGDSAAALLDSLPTNAPLRSQSILKADRLFPVEPIVKPRDLSPVEGSLGAPPSSYDRSVMPSYSPLHETPDMAPSYYDTSARVLYASTGRRV